MTIIIYKSLARADGTSIETKNSKVGHESIYIFSSA